MFFKRALKLDTSLSFSRTSPAGAFERALAAWKSHSSSFREVALLLFDLEEPLSDAQAHKLRVLLEQNEPLLFEVVQALVGAKRESPGNGFDQMFEDERELYKEAWVAFTLLHCSGSIMLTHMATSSRCLDALFDFYATCANQAARDSPDGNIVHEAADDTLVTYVTRLLIMLLHTCTAQLMQAFAVRGFEFIELLLSNFLSNYFMPLLLSNLLCERQLDRTARYDEHVADIRFSVPRKRGMALLAPSDTQHVVLSVDALLQTAAAALCSPDGAAAASAAHALTSARYRQDRECEKKAALSRPGFAMKELPPEHLVMLVQSADNGLKLLFQCYERVALMEKHDANYGFVVGGNQSAYNRAVDVLNILCHGQFIASALDRAINLLELCMTRRGLPYPELHLMLGCSVLDLAGRLFKYVQGLSLMHNTNHLRRMLAAWNAPADFHRQVTQCLPGLKNLLVGYREPCQYACRVRMLVVELVCLLMDFGDLSVQKEMQALGFCKELVSILEEHGSSTILLNIIIKAVASSVDPVRFGTKFTMDDLECQSLLIAAWFRDAQLLSRAQANMHRLPIGGEGLAELLHEWLTETNLLDSVVEEEQRRSFIECYKECVRTEEACLAVPMSSLWTNKDHSVAFDMAHAESHTHSLEDTGDIMYYFNTIPFHRSMSMRSVPTSSGTSTTDSSSTKTGKLKVKSASFAFDTGKEASTAKRTGALKLSKFSTF
ncbi:hypothetical protein FVE85_7311 [Porphyridium purpureum]|uniref:Uncharacterized protein n=1 Tax=Porphyridium purpureum TaxID=35688 RepID=A0A5J4Z7M2_PORPP|nr:hypothetical protein FVE85_7311 [Porphyridium purpureum]|eukprot:POR2077..scf295_1